MGVVAQTNMILIYFKSVRLFIFHIDTHTANLSKIWEKTVNHAQNQTSSLPL